MYLWGKDEKKEKKKKIYSRSRQHTLDTYKFEIKKYKNKK